MPTPTQIHIDLDRLAEIGRVGVRRAAAFLALGHKAWIDEDLTSVSVPVPMGLQFLPDPLPSDLAAEIRREFRTWITGNALGEILQSLHLYLDQLHGYSVLAEAHGGQVEKTQIDRIARFRRDTNLASKIDALAAEAGLVAPLSRHVGGWSMARNALYHNRGVVRVRDVLPKGGAALEVSWFRFEFLLGDTVVPADSLIGTFVAADTVVSIRGADGIAEFPVGSVVAFDEQSILEICLTGSNLVDQFNKALADRLAAIGIGPPPAQ